jgi:hypothetical protein
VDHAGDINRNTRIGTVHGPGEPSCLTYRFVLPERTCFWWIVPRPPRRHGGSHCLRRRGERVSGHRITLASYRPRVGEPHRAPPHSSRALSQSHGESHPRACSRGHLRGRHRPPRRHDDHRGGRHGDTPSAGRRSPATSSATSGNSTGGHLCRARRPGRLVRRPFLARIARSVFLPATTVSRPSRFPRNSAALPLGRHRSRGGTTAVVPIRPEDRTGTRRLASPARARTWRESSRRPGPSERPCRGRTGSGPLR